MRKLLGVIIFCLTFCVVGIAQQDESQVKSQMINEIVKQLVKPGKDQKVMVVVDLEQKKLEAHTGVSGTRVWHLDDKIEDTVVLQLLRNNLLANMGPGFILKTFKELNFNDRYQIIIDSFINNIYPTKKDVYVEIAAPLNGWDVATLVARDYAFSDGDKNFMRFQIPRYCIPVFMWTSESKEKVTYYLFRFDIKYADNKLSTHLIDWKEI